MISQVCFSVLCHPTNRYWYIPVPLWVFFSEVAVMVLKVVGV